MMPGVLLVASTAARVVEVRLPKGFGGLARRVLVNRIGVILTILYAFMVLLVSCMRLPWPLSKLIIRRLWETKARRVSKTGRKAIFLNRIIMPYFSFNLMPVEEAMPGAFA
jgi:hypothetical protein